MDPGFAKSQPSWILSQGAEEGEGGMVFGVFAPCTCEGAVSLEPAVRRHRFNTAFAKTRQGEPVWAVEIDVYHYLL